MLLSFVACTPFTEDTGLHVPGYIRNGMTACLKEYVDYNSSSDKISFDIIEQSKWLRLLSFQLINLNKSGQNG